ncbi:MAG: hypothetical protein OXS35_09420 [Dehalococcoidia bacterium]|nr:hypothetical protein [Dehalococcoidia bacterium]
MSWLSYIKWIAARIGRFVLQCWRLVAVVVVAALLSLPLLGGEVTVFGLNGLGVSFEGLIAHRILFRCGGRILRR